MGDIYGAAIVDHLLKSDLAEQDDLAHGGGFLSEGEDNDDDEEENAV